MPLRDTGERLCRAAHFGEFESPLGDPGKKIDVTLQLRWELSLIKVKPLHDWSENLH